jgi:hypothetical protein
MAAAQESRLSANMSAFDFFDDIWCIHQTSHPARWPVMQRRLARMGIDHRARRFASVPSPADARIGRALSHRRIVQDAAERSLRSVLVIEDETLFLDRTEMVLGAAVAELRGKAWRLLHLGTWRGSDGLQGEPGCAYLRQADKRTGPHAVAYGAAVFAEFLAATPMSFGAMQTWLGEHGSIDAILAGLEPALVVHPAVATVPFSLPYQDPEDQERFVP